MGTRAQRLTDCAATPSGEAHVELVRAPWRSDERKVLDELLRSASVSASSRTTFDDANA